MKSPIDFAQLKETGNRLFKCTFKRRKGGVSLQSETNTEYFAIFHTTLGSHYGLPLKSTITQSKIRITVHITNSHLIVLAALVGREQRTAVLLGQVGYGLDKRHSSYTNFKNILLRN
jgi:hypothetical protein